MSHYRRVLLKLSGETLMGDASFGVSPDATGLVADKILSLQQKGIELGIVIGGGNIFRGIQQATYWGMERAPADQIGMLATLMNGVVLSEALKKTGTEVRLMTALPCPTVAEPYQRDKAINHLNKGRIIIFVGGTGHPFFTTDTSAALKACEIRADILVKATVRTDGIYDRDPHKELHAKKYHKLSFEKILNEKLGIMDLNAIILCMQANIPIKVLNFYVSALGEALDDATIGTLVTKGNEYG